MSKLMIKGQQASGTYANASDIKINEISGMTASNTQEALVALNNSLTQNVTYDATTGFYYMVVMGNLLVMWKQALISTGQGYLKQDNFTLPKAYGDVNAMCIQVTKKGVGTSEALDRATPYVTISDTTHIIVGLEDGHAGLSSTEGQFVMITIVGYSA